MATVPAKLLANETYNVDAGRKTRPYAGLQKARLGKKPKRCPPVSLRLLHITYQQVQPAGIRPGRRGQSKKPRDSDIRSFPRLDGDHPSGLYEGRVMG